MNFLRNLTNAFAAGGDIGNPNPYDPSVAAAGAGAQAQVNDPAPAPIAKTPEQIALEEYNANLVHNTITIANLSFTEGVPAANKWKLNTTKDKIIACVSVTFAGQTKNINHGIVLNSDEKKLIQLGTKAQQEDYFNKKIKKEVSIIVKTIQTIDANYWKGTSDTEYRIKTTHFDESGISIFSRKKKDLLGREVKTLPNKPEHKFHSFVGNGKIREIETKWSQNLTTTTGNKFDVLGLTRDALGQQLHEDLDTSLRFNQPKELQKELKDTLKSLKSQTENHKVQIKENTKTCQEILNKNHMRAEVHLLQELKKFQSGKQNDANIVDRSTAISDLLKKVTESENEYLRGLIKRECILNPELADRVKTFAISIDQSTLNLCSEKLRGIGQEDLNNLNREDLVKIIDQVKKIKKIIYSELKKLNQKQELQLDKSVLGFLIDHIPDSNLADSPLSAGLKQDIAGYNNLQQVIEAKEVIKRELKAQLTATFESVRDGTAMDKASADIMKLEQARPNDDAASDLALAAVKKEFDIEKNRIETLIASIDYKDQTVRGTMNLIQKLDYIRDLLNKWTTKDYSATIAAAIRPAAALPAVAAVGAGVEAGAPAAAAAVPVLDLAAQAAAAPIEAAVSQSRQLPWYLRLLGGRRGDNN